MRAWSRKSELKLRHETPKAKSQKPKAKGQAPRAKYLNLLLLRAPLAQNSANADNKILRVSVPVFGAAGIQ